MKQKPRYAIYFSPSSQSQLGQFGEMWLGRNAKELRINGWSCPDDCTSDQHSSLVKTPHHYGFHATIKAPFELNKNTDCEALTAAVKEFCRVCTPFSLGNLALCKIRTFLALVPIVPCPELLNLHKELIYSLESFRTPIKEYDRLRYAKRNLSKDEKINLETFGYPYIFDFFRFHLTLTRSMVSEEEDSLYIILKNLWANYQEDQIIFDRVSIFSQQNREMPFVELNSFPFLEEK
ncbi:MAG: DUF1045 domain-containing protein [Desulfotalea sp.]